MMNLTRKQMFLILGGAVALLIVFSLTLAFQQNSQQPSTKITAAGVTPGQSDSNQANGSGGSGNQNSDSTPSTNGPTATPIPEQVNTSAVSTTQTFYDSFAKGNPLANGAFKTNQYLSDNFKNIINISYKNGNKPVFCAVNHKPQVTVGKEQQLYYDNGYITEETISDAVTGRDLYLVMLQSNNDQWHIFDISCL
ncbi:MAG: hypothetical protein ACREHC_04330 [Candidatus Levyibacteriota bacterium]